MKKILFIFLGLVFFVDICFASIDDRFKIVEAPSENLFGLQGFYIVYDVQTKVEYAISLNQAHFFEPLLDRDGKPLLHKEK